MRASSFPTVNAGSSTTSGPISVTASNGFTGTISLTCSLSSRAGSCSVSPATVTSIPTTAYVTVNATTLTVGGYQLVVQGTSGSTTHALLIPFNVGDFQVSGLPSLTLGPGAQGTVNLTVTASTYYGGNITSTCIVNLLPGANCSVTPSPATVSAGSTVPLVATVNVPNNAAPGTYNVSVHVSRQLGYTQSQPCVPAHRSGLRSELFYGEPNRDCWRNHRGVQPDRSAHRNIFHQPSITVVLRRTALRRPMQFSTFWTDHAWQRASRRGNDNPHCLDDECGDFACDGDRNVWFAVSLRSGLAHCDDSYCQHR